MFEKKNVSNVLNNENNDIECVRNSFPFLCAQSGEDPTQDPEADEGHLLTTQNKTMATRN